MVSTLKSAPEPTLRRLPSYHHYLKQLQHRGRDVVSCSHIGRALNLDPTQVRKDIETTGIVGKPRVGYEVSALIKAIEDFLDWNNVTDAFLVGVGNLGTALLGYRRFKDYGINLVAAFDIDRAKIGKTIHGKEILPMEKLPDLARRMHVKIGIITTPAEVGQTIANLMIEGGIRAIWNFAPVTLQVPEDRIVLNEDLYSSLAVLSNRLAESLKSKNATGGSAHVAVGRTRQRKNAKV